MIKNTLFFLIFLFILSFVSFVFFTYFSDENKSLIFQNRESIRENYLNNLDSLKFLRSDTENIIEYNFETKNKEKKKERKFWNIIKENE
tara:strand:- start:659 stop:925 length:267 start_codon:yes stop_codon:yes gene_type:complete